MKSLGYELEAGVRRFVLQDSPEPEIGPYDLLILLRAGALSRASFLNGVDCEDASEPSGIEISGEIEAMGSDVRGFRLGEQVAAVAPGAFAQLIKVDCRLAMKIPPSVDIMTAAALPFAYAIAHNALVSCAAINKNDSLLIRGAGGGIGVAIIQLAKHIGVRQIIGLTRSAEKIAQLTEIGLDRCFVDDDDDLPGKLSDCVDGAGFTVVIDHLGGVNFSGLMDLAAHGGRFVSIGHLTSAQATIDLGKLASKRLRLFGVPYRDWSWADQEEMTEAFVTHHMHAVASRKLSPLIDSIFSFLDANKALDRLRTNTPVGKVIISP